MDYTCFEIPHNIYFTGQQSIDPVNLLEPFFPSFLDPPQIQAYPAATGHILQTPFVFATPSHNETDGGYTGVEKTTLMLEDHGSSRDARARTEKARNRRKAQNRAAQRAFRERKECYKRHLESMTTTLKATVDRLQEENELLQQALQRIRFENNIIRVKNMGGFSTEDVGVSLGISSSPTTTSSVAQ